MTTDSVPAETTQPQPDPMTVHVVAQLTAAAEFVAGAASTIADTGDYSTAHALMGIADNLQWWADKIANRP